MKPLLDDDELARLTERARLDLQTGVKGEPRSDDDDDEDIEEEEAAHERDHARFQRGLSVLRFVAETYAAERDPRGLRPIVWAAWGVRAGRFDDRVGAESVLAAAVESVGARVLEVPGLAERLAGSELTAVRRALATALPAGAGADPILRVLAEDAEPEVRAAAARTIGPIDPWDGAFPISPEGHPEDVIAAARAVLETPWHRLQSDDAVRAFAPLSDELAVACWERLLLAEHVKSDAAVAWLSELLARPGAGDALVRLMTAWDRRPDSIYRAGRVGAVAPNLSEEARGRVFGALARALRRIDGEERADERVGRYLPDRMAEVASKLAPERGDARALLETILGGPIEAAAESEPAGDGTAGWRLSDVLARWPIDDALRATLVEARRAELPGRWKRVSRAVWEGLGPDPVLRERARRALDDADTIVRSRAVYELLGPLHLPAEDGAVLDVARRLYGRPELRLGVIYRDLMIEEARRDLEEGRLELEEAIAVILRTKEEEQTDAMWSAARALRDAPAEDGELRRALLFNVLMIRPGSEWDASDLAYVRAVAEEALTDPEKTHDVSLVITTLDAVDAPESAELFAAIEARATTAELRKEIDEGRELASALRGRRARRS